MPKNSKLKLLEEKLEARLDVMDSWIDALQEEVVALQAERTSPNHVQLVRELTPQGAISKPLDINQMMVGLADTWSYYTEDDAEYAAHRWGATTYL